MKYALCGFVALLFVSCESADPLTVGNDNDFEKHYTSVYYFDAKLQEDQYTVWENDSTIDLNRIGDRTKLKQSEVDELLAIMKDTSCFEKEGECGTYFDNAGFLFYKKDKIIKVITVGCSYSYFSNSPESWPSDGGAINESCDEKRYNPLLKRIWQRMN